MFLFKSIFFSLLTFGVLTFGLIPKNISLIQSSNWELAKNESGIKVFTREKEGSGIKEFKTVATVKIEMSVLENILDDINNYASWQDNVASAKILKKISSSENYYYTTTDVPWPIGDRDIILHSVKTTANKSTITYSLTSTPSYIPIKDDYTRINNAAGKWQLKAQENGETLVIHQFYGDPEGSIPNWIVNMFIVDGPHETMVNLIELVSE